MSRRLAWILLIVLVPAAFLAGRMWSGRGGVPGDTGGREVLYWVDPMNPGFRSSEPGTAPCGMPLEPVYEDAAGAAGAGSPASYPLGTVNVRPDRQQLVGMRIETAERRPVAYSLRLLGRVAPDETRLYRLFSVTEGWIRSVSQATTGSLVRKDDLLATYYSQEVLGPQQAYLYALEALDRFVESGTATPDQLELNRKNVRTTRQTLLNLGMGETQVDAIARTREAEHTVELRAPAAGFLLARNVSPGQRFDRTSELYTIADLSRVWILADAFESEGQWLRPGTKATVRLAGGGEPFAATVSAVPPQFDPTSRTLKVRLEAANPAHRLRPDMFVDVSLDVSLPPALVVPSPAVLDSGLRKTVFVDRGEGFFEPRRVATGFRVGDLVEVTAGLMAGERIVVSGNFLLDSESRMRLAGAGSPPATSRDPVCGMEVEEEKARAEARTSEHGGTIWFFCSPGCKKTFDGDPGAWIAKQGGPAHD